MKRALWFVCVLALLAMAAGPLRAQNNPFLGTWKLNLSKSKFDGMPAPKSLTRTVAAEGAGATYTFTGEDADGKAIEYSFTSHFDGKDSAVTGGGMPGGADTVALTRVNSNMIRTIWKKGRERHRDVQHRSLAGWENHDCERQRSGPGRQEIQHGQRVRRAIVHHRSCCATRAVRLPPGTKKNRSKSLAIAGRPEHTSRNC